MARGDRAALRRGIRNPRLHLHGPLQSVAPCIGCPGAAEPGYLVEKDSLYHKLAGKFVALRRQYESDRAALRAKYEDAMRQIEQENAQAVAEDRKRHAEEEVL